MKKNYICKTVSFSIAMIHYSKPDAFELEAKMTALICNSFGSSTSEDFTQSDPIEW